jgi:hypothetical protein
MLTINEYDAAGAGVKSGEANSKDSLGNKLGWQLALEKAYIQGKEDKSLSVESKRQTAEEVTSEVEYIANFNVNIDQPHRAKIDTSTAQSSERSINVRSLVLSSLTLSESMPKVTSSNKLTSGISANQNLLRQTITNGETVRLSSPDVLYSHIVQTSEKESMSLINSDEGIHLLIRSTELNQTAAIKISESVRRALAGKGRSLVKVILNGKCITSLSSEPRIENADTDHKIDLTY